VDNYQRYLVNAVAVAVVLLEVGRSALASAFPSDELESTEYLLPTEIFTGFEQHLSSPGNY